MNYKIKLKKAIASQNSHLIAGIDPDATKFPHFIRKKKNPLYEFCKYIIEITSDLIAGYKFNLAFFESQGYQGIKTLEMLLENRKEKLVYICDAKRGDIGNSSEQYAKAYFDRLGFDAITVCPYMGIDSIFPFLKRKNKLAYILALTSNKGSGDFQMLKTGHKHLYQFVCDKFLNSGQKNIGFVFGANYSKEIRIITSKNNDLPLLIPGIGAQGGDLIKLIRNLKNDYFLINSSRNILFAGSSDDNMRVYTRKVRNQCNILNDIIKSFKKQ
jgi:orotidine-5'-phosphate decarboxylase